MFGFELIDASLLPALIIAFVAGILSFLSPCVLPIVPPYLAYMSGVSMGEMSEGRSASRKATLAALFFVMGLSTVFLFLGFAASAFGAFFLQNQTLFATFAVPTFWGLLSRLAGHPVSARNWVRSCLWPRLKDRSHGEPRCWPYMLRGWVFPSCWLPHSSPA